MSDRRVAVEVTPATVDRASGWGAEIPVLLRPAAGLGAAEPTAADRGQAASAVVAVGAESARSLAANDRRWKHR
jgi:hypothetical protein